MSNRNMIDVTHQNLPSVLSILPRYDMAAIYLTGSPSVHETDADIARMRATAFGNKPIVTIDQGYAGAPGEIEPNPYATIRDVELGAWTITEAVNRGGWLAPRPTIYISAARLGQLAAAGWDGDVWVADWQSSHPAVPRGARFSLVAWQFRNAGTHDDSIVFDSNWPALNWLEASMRLLPTIRQGATGDAVKTAQALILARDAEPQTCVFAVDGSFGPCTDEAIRILQSRAGLTADGIVGPKTWPVLMGVQ